VSVLHISHRMGNAVLRRTRLVGFDGHGYAYIEDWLGGVVLGAGRVALGEGHGWRCFYRMAVGLCMGVGALEVGGVSTNPESTPRQEVAPTPHFTCFPDTSLLHCLLDESCSGMRDVAGTLRDAALCSSLGTDVVDSDGAIIILEVFLGIVSHLRSNSTRSYTRTLKPAPNPANIGPGEGPKHLSSIGEIVDA